MSSGEAAAGQRAQTRRGARRPAGSSAACLLLLCLQPLPGCLDPQPPPPWPGPLATSDAGLPAFDLQPATDLQQPGTDGGDPPDGELVPDGEVDPDGGLPPACSDPFEPNDNALRATQLTSGRHPGLTLCPGDRDVFALQLQAGDPFDLRALFSRRSGDLDMILTDTVSGRRERYEAGGDNEFARGTAVNSGLHLLEVYGLGDSFIDYDLTVQLGAGCPDDPAEPDSSLEQARLAAPGVQPRVLCPGDGDWLALKVLAGESLLVALRAPASEGEWSLELLVAGARAGDESTVLAAVSGPASEQPLVLSAGPLAGGGRAWLKVQGTTRYWADYQLEWRRLAPDAERTVRLVGTVTRDDLTVDARGLGAPVPVPCRDTPFEVVRPLDDQVLGRGTTDDEGRFTIELPLLAGLPCYLRVLAEGDEQGAVVQVHSGLPLRLHAHRGPDLLLPADSPGALHGEVTELAADVHIPVGSIAGAFNVLEVVRRGLSRLAGWVPLDTAQPLMVLWQPGLALSCGSCYGWGFLQVGGGLEDPDEFDDSVLLHELGHYVAEQWSSDDSPGGSHHGEQVLPTLAWSEGWATFHVGLQTGAPDYYDYRLTDVLVRDIESTPATPDAYGTRDGLASGDVSEHLVSAVLWDLFDAPAVDDDPLAGGDALLDPFFGYLAGPRAQDAGARGVDLQDYLDGWVCRGLGERGLLQQLLADRHYPYDPTAAPADCPAAATPRAGVAARAMAPPGLKPGVPLDARLLLRDAGHGVLQLRALAPAGRLELRIFGRPPRALPGLPAGGLLELPVSAPPGLPLLVGVTAVDDTGQRLHVVARRAGSLDLRGLSPETTAARVSASQPGARLSGVRSVAHAGHDAAGRLLLEWEVR